MDIDTILTKHKKEVIIIGVALLLVAVMLISGIVGDSNDVINPTKSTTFTPYISPSLHNTASNSNQTFTDSSTTNIDQLNQMLDTLTWWMPLIGFGLFIFFVWRIVRQHNDF